MFSASRKYKQGELKDVVGVQAGEKFEILSNMVKWIVNKITIQIISQN